MSSEIEYKLSSIDWLNKIPSHWTAYRLANTGTFSKGKGIAKADIIEDGKPAILYGDIYTRYSIVTDSLERRVSDETAANAVPIYQGDLLFTGSGETPIDIGRCVCYTGTETGYAGGDIIIYRQNEIDGKFLSYMFNSFYLDQQKAVLAKGGIIIHIYSSQLKSIKFPLPPRKEQHQIATYLDRETARIDALIDAKERLLRVLEEKRSVMIAEAVTRGLNADVRMKDSGVDWLGEVPEHWEVVPIKYLADLKSGNTISPLDIDEEEEYPVYGGNGFRGYTKDYTHNGLYALIGRQGALCGNINYAEGKFWASEHAIVVDPKPEVNTIWLGEVLREMNLNQYSISAAQPGLSVDRIKNIFIPSPPVTEQKKIADYITEIISSHEQLGDKLNDSINLLSERRSSLITSAVTGAINV
ncbi:restriction endonuclease subunit S [Neolewinella agarilytica]|uniref:Type I restriction enzyme, S subunit n=1 Tax=Neolewinella agarilytica TaxID=478744 RepID=A0A1H9HDK8_9BACT|nr:restriction endonuclease subunit S [Neolewinella agarilytica]SEQ60377.1 type I restriction enzyme, S subunit [Neolewinella agarilytica]